MLKVDSNGKQTTQDRDFSFDKNEIDEALDNIKTLITKIISDETQQQLIKLLDVW